MIDSPSNHMLENVGDQMKILYDIELKKKLIEAQIVDTPQLIDPVFDFILKKKIKVLRPYDEKRKRRSRMGNNDAGGEENLSDIQDMESEYLDFEDDVMDGTGTIFSE